MIFQEYNIFKDKLWEFCDLYPKSLYLKIKDNKKRLIFIENMFLNIIHNTLQSSFVSAYNIKSSNISSSAFISAPSNIVLILA